MMLLHCLQFQFYVYSDEEWCTKILRMDAIKFMYNIKLNNIDQSPKRWQKYLVFVCS